MSIRTKYLNVCLVRLSSSVASLRPHIRSSCQLLVLHITASCTPSRFEGTEAGKKAISKEIVKQLHNFSTAVGVGMSLSEFFSSGTLLDNETILAIEKIANNDADRAAISDRIEIPTGGIHGDTQALNLKLALLKIELNNFTKSTWIEALYLQILKTVLPKAQSAFTSNDPTIVYAKIKYEDLFSDYQYLAVANSSAGAVDSTGSGTQPEHPKMMDLINKKLTLLNNVPENAYSSRNSVSSLVASIYKKVIDLLLLTGNDFLKKNLLHHLDQKLKITSHAQWQQQSLADRSAPVEDFNEIFPEITRSFFKTTVEGRLVPIQKFGHFISSNDSGPYVKQIAGFYSHTLLENHYENNVSSLTKYYDNISLRKVSQLLLSLDGSEFDFEELIFKMILDDKLPPGTTLDQFDQTLHFPIQESYNRMQDICDIIEEITSLIEISEVK